MATILQFKRPVRGKEAFKQAYNEAVKNIANAEYLAKAIENITNSYLRYGTRPLKDSAK